MHLHMLQHHACYKQLCPQQPACFGHTYLTPVQVLTSANWGGRIGNFFTGGLNLQIEHHLFPAISFVHYPAIAKIVRDECEKRGIPYAHYDTLPEIVGRFSRCAHHCSPTCISSLSNMANSISSTANSIEGMGRSSKAWQDLWGSLLYAALNGML